MLTIYSVPVASYCAKLRIILRNKNIIFNKTNTFPNILHISARSFSKKRNIPVPKKLWLKKYLTSV